VRQDLNPGHRRTLPIQPRRHSASVVYCTYLTHFRTLQLYQCMLGYEQGVHAGKDVVLLYAEKNTAFRAVRPNWSDGHGIDRHCLTPIY